MVKKKGGDQVIGVVGGVKIPPVDSFLAGYQAGAKKCNPGIKVLKGYSQDFIDQAKCKTVAQNQIDAGSQVEFNVAGPCGLGTLDAAKEAGIWGIGVDVDQAYLGKHILTSAVKRVDTGVYLAIKGAQNGQFKGGKNLVFNLKNGGVGMGKISSSRPRQVPEDDRRPSGADRRRQDQAAGEGRLAPLALRAEGGPSCPPSAFLRRIAPRGRSDTARPRAPRHHEALPGRPRERLTSTSTSARARCTRCSARTAPASRR